MRNVLALVAAAAAVFAAGIEVGYRVRPEPVQVGRFVPFGNSVRLDTVTGEAVYRSGRQILPPARSDDPARPLPTLEQIEAAPDLPALGDAAR